MSHKSFYITAVAVALAAAIGFIVGRGARDLQVAPVLPVPASPQAVPQAAQKPTCEGREQITETDLFAAGSIAYSDGKGAKTAASDECSGTGLQVNKMYCYESPFGSGNFIPGKIVYKCPFGCGDGACKTGARSDFSPPYPILWTNDGIDFSLTGAALAIVSSSEAAVLPGGATSSNGILTTDAVVKSGGQNKITLYLKLENKTHAYKKPEITMRYLSNENGDLVAPAAERISLPSNDAFPDRLGPLMTIENQEIEFLVPANAGQYEFTAASSSGAFFTIGMSADGNVEIMPEATNG